MKKYFKYFAIGIAMVIIAFLFIVFFNEREKPVKIGLMVTLTGIYPDLGREIRDGALLATEIINEKGGVNGRPIKLIIKDNQYDIDIAKMNYQELYKENVIAVIGPATSTTAKNMLPLINEKKLVTIAPTPTSSELAGLDDYMIRLRPTNKEDAEVLANYIKKNLKIDRIAIIYDIINPAYTHDFINNFRTHFKKELNILSYPFDEKRENIKEFSRKILNNSPNAVLLLVDVYNASLFIQHLKIAKPDLIILATIWSKSPKLIEQSGKWIEGLITVDVVVCEENMENNEDKSAVKKRYYDKFGKDMSFAAINGYDSVLIIKKAVENGATRENIKETILKINRFEGLQGEIVFDEFGDIQKKPSIIKVENGRFKRVIQ